jgi:hypothetical protein
VEKYIGTKIIEAEPMTSEEFNEAIRQLFYSGDDKRGYKVKYEDGYISWSPKDVFEKAYRAATGMTFGLAIEAMRQGKRVARKGWNGKDIFIQLQVPDEYSKMTQPYIYIDTLGLKTNNPNAPKGRVPWLASQTDMLSDDWEVVEG